MKPVDCLLYQKKIFVNGQWKGCLSPSKGLKHENFELGFYVMTQ